MRKKFANVEVFILNILSYKIITKNDLCYLRE